MNKIIVYKLAFIASLGGFLFGFDTAVISGTIGLVQDQFGLSAVMTGWYVSSALVGTIVGTLLAGVLSDKYGRKEILIVSAILFGLSALGCMLSESFQSLIVYRLLGGVGVGLASILSPMYISEIAPAKIRGSLVSLFQFAITLGILVAYFTNAKFLGMGTSNVFVNSGDLIQNIFVNEVWRVMLGSEVLPAILFLVLLFFIPKSPRWHLNKKQVTKAEVILIKILGKQGAEKELSIHNNNVQSNNVGFKTMFKGGFKIALIVGVVLAISTQFCGINAVIYYGPRILEDSGLKLGEALDFQIVIGIVNVIFTSFAIWKIDQFGRKKLLLYGISGIIFSLITIGLLFYLEVNNPYLLIGFILLFVACFSFSFGPVIWVVLSEIYPTSMRGIAMSIATFALWLGATLVAQLVPWLLENLKPHGTFWLFALLAIPSMFIVLKLLPETKGKTLEEIENYWVKKN